MAVLEINSRYRDLLEQVGLTSLAQVLALPAVIVSGHPDRNVARVRIGDGLTVVPAFLKREHRVRRRDRLASAWAGFGFVSKSLREARTLQALRQAGVGCPDWIAAGEDDHGRAFLLIEEVAGAVDLRCFLREQLGPSPEVRRRFACQLGRALARLHAAGYDHPDLYSRHVLVETRTHAIRFLDWQRSRPGRHGGERDLAALDATLTPELATARDRLCCLRAYLRERGRAPRARRLGLRIRRFADHLLRRRHVREARFCPPLMEDGVIWLDGEALCVTARFLKEMGGRLPDWLPVSRSETGLTYRVVPVTAKRRGLLIHRRQSQLLGWLWRLLRRRPVVSPELREAGRLFRLQRQGAMPRLLAFGQRQPRPWQTESFLLTEIDTSAKESDG